MAYPHDLPAMEDLANASNIDLSPSATTIPFEPILPLLRIPVPAGADDDPSKGPYVLAFKDEATWRRAWNHCEEQVAAQCEAAAMKVCSINASKACSPAWWGAFLPSFGTTNDREACEEKSMAACLAASRVDGLQFAKAISKQVFEQAKFISENKMDDRTATISG